MELPTQSVNVTELDFENIKTSLIDYFKDRDSQFKDWDYAGSGLNLLVDLLSHNTHYNAILAHMAVNESFIDSAQLRQNVVSSAKLIGYTPRSVSASKAVVSISIDRGSDTSEFYIVPRGSSFIANGTDMIQNGGYRFTNLDDLVFNINNGFVNNKVSLHQGKILTKRIQINSSQDGNEYIIEDKNIDLSTLKVSVYQNGRSEINEVYNLFSDINAVDENSPIYFLYENYNGNYVVSFGNGVFGKKPDNLNILELNYLVSDGSIANGFSSFTFSDNFQGFTNVLNIISSGKSFGGADRESISSIKYNAPLQYIAQNRAVTADDYKTLIYNKIPNIKSITVWGGEENDPPQYGKVFISVRKHLENNSTDDFLNDMEKQEILSYLNDKKVLSIIPEIIDPEYVNVVLDVLFKYNRNLTTYTQVQLENLVKQSVTKFNNEYLDSFDGVFRHSMLSKIVDSTSPSILNSHIRVYVSKTVQLISGSPQSKTLKYGVALTVDDDIAIVNSTGWTYEGITYYIGDESDAKSNDFRNLYVYYYDSDNKPVIRERNIGKIQLSTGLVEIGQLLTDEDTSITLDLIPLSNDIAPKRNQLVRIETSKLNISGEVDIIAIGGSNRSIDYKTFSRDR